MNLTGILKSLLLVVASIVLWATPVTLLQLIGYLLALVGMFYYALPAESSPRPTVLIARAAGLVGLGTRIVAAAGGAMFSRGRQYDAVPDGRDGASLEAFLPDDEQEKIQGRRSE